MRRPDAVRRVPCRFVVSLIIIRKRHQRLDKRYKRTPQPTSSEHHWYFTTRSIMSLPTRKIGKDDVTATGFGLMGLSAFYGAIESDEERFKVCHDLKPEIRVMNSRRSFAQSRSSTLPSKKGVHSGIPPTYTATARIC